MIVLGDQRVDFLVTQFANGVAVDDCQECLVGSGPDEAGLDGVVRRERMGRRRRSGEGEKRVNEVEVEVEVDLRGWDFGDGGLGEVYHAGDREGHGRRGRSRRGGRRTSKL